MTNRFQTPAFDAMMRRELARLQLPVEELSVSSYKERMADYAGLLIVIRYLPGMEIPYGRANRLDREGHLFSRWGPPYSDVRQWGMAYNRARGEVLIELSEADDPAYVGREVDAADPFDPGKDLDALVVLQGHLMRHFLALSHVACAHPLRSAEDPSEWVVPPMTRLADRQSSTCSTR